MTSTNDLAISRRESTEATSAIDAGCILASGGWAVFPVPEGRKHDTKLSWLYATTDPALFRSMVRDVQSRHGGVDVNVAIAPNRCDPPLLAVDLDGQSAIDAFAREAVAQGHADLNLWLRTKSPRLDGGRHAWFVAPDGQGFNAGSHRWGGEVRGKGHVLAPPSWTSDGRYVWTGEALATTPKWVTEGLGAGTVDAANDCSDAVIDEYLDLLSKFDWTPYGRAAVTGMLTDLRRAQPGDGRWSRNATLTRVVYRTCDLALQRELPALDALDSVMQLYPTLFTPTELATRNVRQEVIRCVRSWVRKKDGIADRVSEVAAVHRWVADRSGSDFDQIRGRALEIAHAADESVRRLGTSARAGDWSWKARSFK